ncbi:hypothetical protein SAMN05192559_11213 [Halobacillus karajensis]|uniref:Uncharacterized protein n=1 Tax=Halobacillus karajensis TaxID=195088 RepID=A0A024P889_9BACI|nr:hypothetical protein BN982_03609 [Halobacillus karajensis]CDQ25319.1 hypothetical protein BN983_03637 [Halobacillus karajensis]CDQ25958.1 hypothetical protein BN981_00165 [Halobacillus karajensis]SEI10006.1 hypothetical protein SAMN05192559_11213 [Halobacillus karajensis]
MVKSIKGQFVLILLAAFGFIIHSFSYIEFTGEERFLFNRILFYFIMILSVFNAGMITQKYIHLRKKKKSSVLS